MLTIQRHLEACDHLDFDQSAWDEFYYVFFTNRAVGLSRLAINMQNNPVPNSAAVKNACADFERRVDVLNDKMTNSLSKLSKGGPRRGFDDRDLQQLPEKGVLISTLQAQAYRPAVYSSPAVRQLRNALVETINKSCLEGLSWAPWDEPIFASVAEEMQDFDEVADREELKTALSNRQIIARQRKSIQHLVNTIQKTPEAQVRGGALDSDVAQSLVDLVQCLEMNASHLRWTELKRKGPWQAPAEEDSSEKLDIVIGDSASSLPTAENDEDDSAVDDEGALNMNGREKASAKEAKPQKNVKRSVKLPSDIVLEGGEEFVPAPPADPKRPTKRSKGKQPQQVAEAGGLPGAKAIVATAKRTAEALNRAQPASRQTLGKPCEEGTLPFQVKRSILTYACYRQPDEIASKRVAKSTGVTVETSSPPTLGAVSPFGRDGHGELVTFGENEREIQYEIDEAGGLVYPESAANPSPEEVMYLALRVFRATPCLKPLLDAKRLGTAKWKEIVTSEAQRAKISKKLDQMAFTREDLDAPYSQPVLHQLQYWVDFFAIKALTQPSSTFQIYEGHSTNILGMLRYQAHHSPAKVVGFRDFSPNGIMNRALGLALAGSRRKSITLPSASPTVIISTEPASPSDPQPVPRRPRPAIPLVSGVV
ncbi:hypothetical protein PILCRDRAFT_17352 [Piloderma croceum F 1598]|uniref:Uncharacterized protein n=1 Tax=Piloderma croceum (strain F 1598) TaxID=765440 RepID=A0A0C3B1M5_PILCF|nr:hypothetical protein PILCRDRAFT_17352 [Piloderma croceum F 1598]